MKDFDIDLMHLSKYFSKDFLNVTIISNHIKLIKLKQIYYLQTLTHLILSMARNIKYIWKVQCLNYTKTERISTLL